MNKLIEIIIVVIMIVMIIIKLCSIDLPPIIMTGADIMHVSFNIYKLYREYKCKS